MTQTINDITDIIFNHIGGMTFDPDKSEAVYQYAKEIAKEITDKVSTSKRVETRTNTDPKFDRYRTFPEYDAAKDRQSLEHWLSCLQQGKNPVEEVLRRK